ncbi:hypothetical protein RND81_14G018400 [Saponaria officinalis]|uniref:Uncharacterized protein n=1 Tax=Saponaria officinalis TaxID=3572 RepID=A0AAW1GP56_SAPOF
MADLIQFNQNSNDSPLFSRGYINNNMNSDVVNLKKRKLLSASDSGLPAPKHKCRESAVDSEHDVSSMSSMVTDDVHTWENTQADSNQDSNSFHGDTQSGNVDIKVDANTESNDEASTSWDDSGSGHSRNRPDYVESSVIRDRKDGKEEARLISQDTDRHDIDGLDECLNIEQTNEGLHELISSTGVDPKIFALQSESWAAEQETEAARRKPTIDQEFEQYFSTLML